MFEDNPLEPSPFVFDSTDVFSNLADLDSFSFSSPSSSSGQHSPAFSTIPTIAEPQSELNNAWFNFSNINDDALNAKTIASHPIPDTPWDFLTFSNDSPDSGATSPFSPTFAIDPQLMATPATSKSPSDFGDDDGAKDEHPREEDDEEEDEEPVTPPPVKLSNKGKDRKSAVLSGGVQKKVHISSVVKTDPYDNASDDWRPTPEEYQKMSSREKRQLRNKISARNFRNRRKEYITTLESDVAERDRLIDAIRTELGSTRSENVALQQEIRALKKALLTDAGHADSPVLPPPSPLSLTPPASASRSSASTSPLLTPNTHKDMPATASPSLAAKAFWGGSSTAFGGITPVHTVTIPDLIAGAALKPTLQENINPALNNNNNVNSVGLSTLGGPGKPAPFDSFMDTNPFTMKMLDAYRMQLWTRMAQQQQQQQAAASQQQQQQQYPSSPPLSGLAANLRPHYFSSTSTPTKRSAAPAPSLSSLLSGKHHSHTPAFTSAASAYPTPPASPQPGSTSTTSQMPTPQHAALATMASQTLVQRLGSAFWQAFSGSSSIYPPSSPTSNARAPAWDAEKVRRVLEGTAVVRVVDVDPPAVSSVVEAAAVAPKESKEVQTQTQCQGPLGCAKLTAARDTGLSVLEESMRALTLGKK